MTKQELIDKLEKDPIEEYIYGTDVDPLVVEGKLNLILQYLKRPGEADGTDVYLLDQFIKRLDFKENPQDAIDRLDGLIDSLDSTKADNDQLQAVINSLADKANVGTEKESTLSVSTLSEFQDHFYQLRKLPSRSYQYEVSSSLNLDLMDVLGWPNGNGNQAFIYVDLPYNESGGFELDITYIERFHNNMYKRTMTSTNNGNWQDTNWVQYVSKAEVNENMLGAPSLTIDNNVYTKDIPYYEAPTDGYLWLEIERQGKDEHLQFIIFVTDTIRVTDNLRLTPDNAIITKSYTLRKGQRVRINFMNSDSTATINKSIFVYPKEV